MTPQILVVDISHLAPELSPVYPAQQVMEARGYLVIASVEPLVVGSVFHGTTYEGTPGPMFILQETTLDDFKEQIRFVSTISEYWAVDLDDEQLNDSYFYFPYRYRVIAE